MSFLCTTPDERFGTVAELNGTLVGVENGSSPAMQELENTPLYPSIHFEPVEPVSADFVTCRKDTPNFLETAYNDLVKTVQQQWEQSRPAIEATPVYEKGRQVYEYIYNNYLKTPESILEHPLFNSSNQDSIRCLAWHPHAELLAVAHNDNNVYIYEKKEKVWTCQVLAHEKMNNITCIEWKSRSAGTLAVGCKEGVCVWTVERNETYNQAKPRYHPHAFMRYLQYPGQDYISSLTWDPTPGSHLLAVVSAISNTLVIHDILLNRTIPLKRYGKGNILLRWSPNGEWLFEGGSSGTSRMWDTSDWSSQQVSNPPGLWIQAACWSPDNRTLIYSMCGKSDIHALFLSGKSIKSDIVDVKVLSTPVTTVNTESGSKVTVGGVIRDITIDQRNGQRLAVAYENSSLIALFSVKRVSPLNVRQDPMLFPVGYIRGAQTSYNPLTRALDISPITDSKPLATTFSSSFKDGALMAVAWDNGTITFITHTFLTDEELRKRFM